jgi:transcription-repair coupling factor (superfamily II helicase)
LETPPADRQAVETRVGRFDPDLVRHAVLRELSREGQVFFVHNRVESIHHVEQKLRKLVPTAKIGVAHGQMHEKEIEPIMLGFIKGEVDVLLSTTIVESGLDIPNANTLIVEQADRLGLAQLYQLRGRVGRSDRQAYAYLLYSSSVFIDQPPSVAEANLRAHGGRSNKKPVMSEGAMARLQALQEFSNLGSGYSLAFRDLQIRGAGELLGKKQHGAMITVGYELYTQLINEAVAQLKNTVDTGVAEDGVRDPLTAAEPLPAFEVPIKALLPETYIKDQSQRLYYYQRMMSARDEATLGEVQGEVEDRYGHPTEEVTNAFAIMGQRMRARDVGIDKLDARGGRLSISFKDRGSIPPRAISILGKKNREMFTTRESMVWPYSGNPILAVERFLMLFQDSLRQVQQERESLKA